MNESHPPPADVPTLTEVIGPAEELPSAVVLPLRVVRDVPARPDDVPAPPAVPALEPQAPLPVPYDDLDEDALLQEVLLSVQLQVDRLLEYRLRDAMAPLLERVMTGVLLEARDELAATLHDVVRRAVVQALARHRSP